MRTCTPVCKIAGHTPVLQVLSKPIEMFNRKEFKSFENHSPPRSVAGRSTTCTRLFPWLSEVMRKLKGIDIEPNQKRLLLEPPVN